MIEQPEGQPNELINIENEEDQLNGTATSREVEIKSKIHFIKAALQNLKSNFPQFKSVSNQFHINGHLQTNLAKQRSHRRKSREQIAETMSTKQFSAERGCMLGSILISPKQSEQRAIHMLSL